MIKIVFCALAFISFNAYSAWDKTGQSDGFMTYVDTSTIKINGSISSMTGLFDNDKPSLVSGNEVRSSINYFEFNCQQKTYRTVRYSLHSGQMGRGQQLIDVRKDSEWKNASGFYEFAWKIACGYITKK
jgi:hypothetical protein